MNHKFIRQDPTVEAWQFRQNYLEEHESQYPQWLLDGLIEDHFRIQPDRTSMYVRPSLTTHGFSLSIGENDWLVRDPDGNYDMFTDELFKATFKQI